MFNAPNAASRLRSSCPAAQSPANRRGIFGIICGVGGNGMSIMIDLPPAMAQEAREYATVQGTTLERMVVDYLKMQLTRKREADDVYGFLMRQSGWLPDDYVFNREEAVAARY